MEDYRLEQSGQEVQDILNGAAMQSDLTAETERAELAEQTLQGNIDIEERDRKAADLTLQGNIDAEELRAKAAEKQNADDIDALEEKVPSGASSSNKLATEEYVNDLVSTATATFRGTFNLVSDLHLTLDATEFQIATQLALAIATADNNDYCFIQVPTSSETPTEINEIDRYKFNGTAWSFEYKLNNSGFTSAQWAAINSGITANDVTKLSALPTNAQLTTLLNGKQDMLTFDSVPTDGSNNPVKSGGVYSAIDDEKDARLNSDAALQQAIEAILLLIPSAASSLNQLADKAFVNSSVATASATFRGTYNLVTNLSLTVSATHAQIATALAGAVYDEDNNDYAFVQIPTSDATPTQIAKTERYKFNGTAWEYEYDLNNSGYTAAQWAAINSGITDALVTKLSDLPTNAELTSALGVLTSSITTINQKIPSAASQANQLVDTAAMESYIVQVLDVLTASFNVTSTDGHVTVSISQVDGKITSVAVSTSDIASAASLSLIAGRVTTAEGNISTNTQDIAFLREAYNTIAGQSNIVVVSPTDTWPVASPSQNIIYRVVDRVNTPPQYYSDYMWNGTAWVLMATYDNAIDDVPTAGSNNLAESGGIYRPLASLSIQQVVKDKIEVEETLAIGGSIYIHNGNWAFRGYIVSDYASNAALAQTMGVGIVTSPRGFTNCIEIADTKSLVLDTTTGLCSIKSRSNLTINDHILVSCSDGKAIHIESSLLCLYYLQNEKAINEDLGCVKSHLNSEVNAIENYSWQGKDVLNDSTFIYNNGKIRSIDKIPVNAGESVRWNSGIADVTNDCVMLLYDGSGNVIEWYSAHANSRVVSILPNCTHIQVSFVKGANNIGVFHIDGTPIYIPKTKEEAELKYEKNIYDGYGYYVDGKLLENEYSLAMVSPIAVSGGETVLWGCGIVSGGDPGYCCLVGMDANGAVTEYWSAYQTTRKITLDANTRFVYASFAREFDGKGIFAENGSVLFVPGTGSDEEIIKELDNKSFGKTSNVYINKGWNTTGNLVDVDGIYCTKEKVSISGVSHLVWRCGKNNPNENYAALLFFDSSDNILEWYSSNAVNRVIDVPVGASSFLASFKSEYLPASVISVSGTMLFMPVLPSLQDQIESINTDDIVINENKIEDLAGIIGNAQGNIESFMLFSDPHWYQNYDNIQINPSNVSIMKRMFEYWKKTSTDFSICLGDWLTAHKKSIAIKALAQIDAAMNKGFDYKYYPVYGNHDNNYQGEQDATADTNANDGALTNQQMVNLMFRKWGKMYYDFKGNNTRFFTFDTGIDWVTAMDSYKWEQIAWFANSLLANTDQHIVLLMHIVENIASTPEGFLNNVIPMAQNVSLIAQAFNSRTQITMNGITYDFSGATGTIHCIICGHTHFDAVGTLNSIPVYCITCTKNEEAYDLIVIDYGSMKLKSVRIGAGNNREMNI